MLSRVLGGSRALGRKLFVVPNTRWIHIWEGLPNGLDWAKRLFTAPDYSSMGFSWWWLISLQATSQIVLLEELKINSQSIPVSSQVCATLELNISTSCSRGCLEMKFYNRKLNMSVNRSWGFHHDYLLLQVKSECRMKELGHLLVRGFG